MLNIIKNNSLVILFCLAIICNIFCANEVPFFIIAISIEIILFLYWRRGKIYFSDLWIWGILLIFCAVILSSSQDSKSFKILELIFMVLSYQVFIMGSNENFREQLRRINGIILFFVCTFGTYELLMRYNPLINYFQKDYISNLFGMSQYRLCNIYSHPIIYAHLLLISFFLTLFLVKKSIMKNIFLLLIVIQLIFTQTRSAWIVFFISIIIFIFRKHRLSYKQLLKAAFSIGVIGIILVFLNYKYNFLGIITERFLYLQTDNVSLTQRLGSIEFVGKEYLSGNILQILFGFGNRASANLMRNTIISIVGFSTTDNQYISLIYNFGFFAIIFLISLLIKIIKVKSENEICFYTLVCSLGMLFFYEGLYWPVIYIVMVFLYAGLIQTSKTSTRYRLRR